MDEEVEEMCVSCVYCRRGKKDVTIIQGQLVLCHEIETQVLRCELLRAYEAEGLSFVAARKRLCLVASITLPDQHLNLSLCGIQLLFTLRGKADALLKKLEGVLQRELPLFKLSDDIFKFLE